MVEKIRKPRMLKDWAEERRIVIDPHGGKHVLFLADADRVFNAGMKVYQLSQRRLAYKKKKSGI